MTKQKEIFDMRLRNAVIARDVDLVKSLLQEDLVVQALARQDEDGLTPLHHAVIADDIRILKELLSKINPLETVDREGKTPIFYAKSEEVFELLFSSADESTIKTILITSVSEGNIDQVKWCINLDYIKPQYFPLHYANTVEMAQLLVKYGADPRIANADGLTPAQALVALRPHESIELLGYLNEAAEYLNDKERESADSSASEDDAPQEESKVTVRDLIDKGEDLPRVAIGDTEVRYIITNKALKDLQKLQGNARDTMVQMLYSGDFCVVRAKGAVGLKVIATRDGTIRYELKIKNTDLGKLRVHGILLEESKTLVFYDTSYTATGQIRIVQERMTEEKIAKILDSKAIRSIKDALEGDVAMPDGIDEEQLYVESGAPSDQAPSFPPFGLPTTTSSSSSSSTPITLKSLRKTHKSPLEAIEAIAKEIGSQDLTISTLEAEEIRKHIVNMRKKDTPLSLKQLQNLIRVSYAISGHVKGDFLKESISSYIGLLPDPTEHERATLQRELEHYSPFRSLIDKLPKPYNPPMVVASPTLPPIPPTVKNHAKKHSKVAGNNSPVTTSIAPKVIKQTEPQGFLKSHQLQYKAAITSGIIMQAIENRKLIEHALIQTGVIPEEGFISEDSYINFIKTDKFWYFMHFAFGIGLHCLFPNVPAQPQSSWVKAIALPAIKTTSLMFDESMSIKYAIPEEKSSFGSIAGYCLADGLMRGLMNPLYFVNAFFLGSIQPGVAALNFLGIFVDTWLKCYIAHRTNNSIEGLEDFELNKDNGVLDYLSYLVGLASMGHYFHKSYKILRAAESIYSTSEFYTLSKKMLTPIQTGLLIATHSSAIKTLCKDIWHLLFKEKLSKMAELKQSLSYHERAYALRSDDKQIAFKLKELNLNIGVRFEDGVEVKKDLAQALFYYERAYSIDNDQPIRLFIAIIHGKIAKKYLEDADVEEKIAKSYLEDVAGDYSLQENVKSTHEKIAKRYLEAVEKKREKAFEHLKAAYDLNPEEGLQGIINELKDFHLCRKVEVALHENDVISINSMIDKHELNGEVICPDSFLNLRKELCGESVKPISDFKLKNIPFRGIEKNEAFDILEDYFENQEQQLPGGKIGTNFTEEL